MVSNPRRFSAHKTHSDIFLTSGTIKSFNGTRAPSDVNAPHKTGEHRRTETDSTSFQRAYKNATVKYHNRLLSSCELEVHLISDHRRLYDLESSAASKIALLSSGLGFQIA